MALENLGLDLAASNIPRLKDDAILTIFESNRPELREALDRLARIQDPTTGEPVLEYEWSEPYYLVDVLEVLSGLYPDTKYGELIEVIKADESVHLFAQIDYRGEQNRLTAECNLLYSNAVFEGCEEWSRLNGRELILHTVHDMFASEFPAMEELKVLGMFHNIRKMNSSDASGGQILVPPHKGGMITRNASGVKAGVGIIPHDKLDDDIVYATLATIVSRHYLNQGRRES